MAKVSSGCVFACLDELFNFPVPFSYRFQDLFPDANMVRDIQKELDSVIQMGVFNITRLLRKSDLTTGIDIEADEDGSVMHKKYKRTAKLLKEKFSDVE